MRYDKVDKTYKKYRIGLDFDGVLHSYVNGWTGVRPEDKPTPGSLEFVHWLLESGFDICIISSRAQDPDGINAISEWLKLHDFPPIPVYFEKKPCHIYIDDRGFRFEGDFNAVQEFIRENPTLSSWIKQHND